MDEPRSHAIDRRYRHPMPEWAWEATGTRPVALMSGQCLPSSSTNLDISVSASHACGAPLPVRLAHRGELA